MKLKTKFQMKQEWTDIQKTYFSLCILLKAAGYSKGCDSFFIVHTDDYVYDEDPNHPESYKKNDISVYNHYYKNSKETLHHFESPMLEEINNWLLEEKGFYVCIRITNNRYFDYDIYKKVENLTFTKYNLVTTTMTHYTSPDEAYIDAFTILLNYLCGNVKVLGMR